MDWRDITESIMDVCRTTFGDDELIYERSGQAPFTFTGIFQRVSTDVSVQAESSISLHDVRVDIRLADFPFDPQAGDTVTRASTVYEVVEVDFDGFAMTRLYLARA